MSTHQTHTGRHPLKSLLPGAITGAIAACAAMFILAYALHLPGFSVPSALVGSGMIAALAGVLYLTAHVSGKANALRTGVIAGLLAGLISLIAMGSVFAQRSENAEDSPGLALIIAGWVLLGILMTLDIAGIGSLIRRVAEGQTMFLLAIVMFGVTFGMVGIAWRVMVLLPDEKGEDE